LVSFLSWSFSIRNKYTKVSKASKCIERHLSA
jgi:hypothetical protein